MRKAGNTVSIVRFCKSRAVARIKVLCIFVTLAMGIFTLSGCSKSELFIDDDEFTGGLWLKMGDNSIVPTSGINYYDVST